MTPKPRERAPTNLQVDHILPVSKGGGNELSNLQTLCKPCNREKFDKVPE